MPKSPTSQLYTLPCNAPLIRAWLAIQLQSPLPTPPSLAYTVICKHYPPYLAPTQRHIPKPLQMRRSQRCPPKDFSFKTPRTDAWDHSFFISSRRLMNRLSTTEFEKSRIPEYKSWCREIFHYLEIQAWRLESLIKNYTLHLSTSSLPCPLLPLNESAFTYSNSYLNTVEYNKVLLTHSLTHQKNTFRVNRV